MNIHFVDPAPGELKLLAASGVRRVRMDFAWDAIEKAPGQYDFAAYDRFVAALEANGLRPLLILDYANPLYDGGVSPHSEEGRRAFAQWAAASVAHFQGRNILWEMYNEPNVSFWRPEPNVQDYIKLALLVGEAFHDAAPNEAYIGPATSGIDLEFLEACFRAGLLNYWTAVSVHPYRLQDPETASEGFRNLRLLIAKYAPKDRHVPILSSEWGYSSIWEWKGMNEGKQATMLLRECLTNLSNDVPLSIWYDWRDDGADSKNPDFHLGLVQFPYQGPQEPVYRPKPAYLAMQTLARVLDGFRFNKRLATGGPDDYVLLFNRGEDVRLVAWSAASENQKAEIPASPGTFSVTGYEGKERLPLKAGKHGLALDLTDAPLYLVPKRPNALLQVAAAWERLPLEITTRAPQRLAVKLRASNPLSRALEYRTAAGAKVRIPARSDRTIPASTEALRNAEPSPWRVEVNVRGLGRIAQETLVLASNPLSETLLPAGKGVLPVLVVNPSAEDFRGNVELYDVKDLRCRSTRLPLELTQGETEQIVRFDLSAPAEGSYRAGVRVKDSQGGTVSVTGPATVVRLYGLMSRGVGPDSEGLAIVAGGDPQVASKQALTPGLPAEGAPLAEDGVLEITYRFGPGRKFLRVVPLAAPGAAIRGEPRAFGLWVFGDSSGNALFIRFLDASGQLFQEGGRMMAWKGWKFVRFPMDGGHAAFQGGARDGVIHYPIRWDSLFLIDNTRRQKTEGTVYISAPVLFY